MLRAIRPDGMPCQARLLEQRGPGRARRRSTAGYPGFSRSKVAYSQIRPVADASVTEAATRRHVGCAASRSSAGPRKPGLDGRAATAWRKRT